MRRRAVVGLVLLAAGCTGAVGAEGQDVVSSRTEFDLTIADDRALFDGQDLEYRSSVGPYSVWEVTGSAPRIDGPRVYFWDREGGGFAMLCSTSQYFADADTGAQRIHMGLFGGRDGETEVVGSHQSALQFLATTEAKDDFGERIPREPDVDAPAEQGDPDQGLQADDAPEADMVEPISIRFDPAPPVGALVLLRRVALSGVQLGHNDSHAIPSVSCSHEGCTLE